MLRIAFLDPIDWDYVIDTPRTKPLGGSQSALCYLAEELAKRGHAVALYNKTKTPGQFRGVKCFNLSQSPISEFSQYDVVVILNSGSPQTARQIRSVVGKGIMIILWSQHLHDQLAVQGLDPFAHDAWDALVLCTDWQAKGYREFFGIKPERIKIFGNAISPMFENLFPRLNTIAEQKPWPPVLCYTSTPFRGLDVLIEAFPGIRAHIPGTTLKVYSSMSVYEISAGQDPYGPLYEQCRATEGVEYIGSLSQSVLAHELVSATCLAYSNTFAENFSIAVLESMAAGLIVITSGLGGLRETTFGYGHLLTPPPDKKQHAELYAEFAVSVLKKFRSSPAEYALRLESQVRFVNQTATWAVRAREWEEWLSAVVVRVRSQAPVMTDLLSAALQHHQAGRLPEAEALYRQVLQAHPDHHEALHRLGLVAHQTGRHDDAVEYIGRALRLNPGVAEYHNNIGTVYRALGKLEEAVVHYRQALALQPAYPMAHNNLGGTLSEQGKLEEAVVQYRQALALQPAYAEACNSLGNALRAQGKLEEAVVQYRQALALQPAYAMAHNNLGTTLGDLGQLEEAVVHYRQALALQPALAEASYNLGNVLKEQGKVEEAIVQYRQALALRPAYAMAHNNLGNALKEQFKLDEAVAHYRQALAIQPDYADAYNNLGIVLRDQGKHEEATACYRQALAIRPDYVVANSNLLFDMSYASDDAEQTGHEYRKWNDRHARHLALQGNAHANNRNPARRLRVGYVSADFLKHSVSYFMESLLSAHDHGNVEVFCYSNSRHSDATTARLQKSADVWRNIAGMTDGAVADLIVADAIDILVDLSGHTAGNRLLVFARKPAPVQVTYLGYGATTGLSTMDYRLTDEYLSPAGSSEWHSEELVRLPGCYVCYRLPADSPPVAPAPVVTAGHVTIGSFNNLAKVTPAVVGVWAEILRALPAARLILKDRTLADEGQQARFRVLFAKEDVGADRIEFISLIADPLEHLACYGRVDIGLDPFPYNGCTTTCEALWMGVPVITLAGRLSHGRYGVSLLTALKMDEFSAVTPADYVAKVVGLANDPERLAKLRSTLRPRMAASPLCDAESFARKVEQAYRQMWKRWCLSYRRDS